MHSAFVGGFFLLNLVAIEHCLANLPLLDPSWPRHDLWPQHCIMLWSGILLPNLVATGHISNLTPTWPRLTPTWPLTPAMHYALVGGSSYQIWWPYLNILTPGWPLHDLWPLQCLKKSKLVQAPPTHRVWVLCALPFPRRSPDKQQTNKPKENCVLLYRWAW